jgi:hypothetical protein
MPGCTPAAPSHRRCWPRRRAVIHHGSGDTWCWAACQQPGATDIVVLCVVRRRSEDGVGLDPRILRAALVISGAFHGSEETPGYTPAASAPTSSSSSASVEEVNASMPPSSWWSAGAGRAPGCVPAASRYRHLRGSIAGARLRTCSPKPSTPSSWASSVGVERAPGYTSAACADVVVKCRGSGRRAAHGSLHTAIVVFGAVHGHRATRRQPPAPTSSSAPRE